jgi:hypothetical protein
MYQTGVVAVIKVNGKVLREMEDVVYLPFGSEYSVLIKNLKSKRVMVRVSIDGIDTTDGTSLVIGPNSEIELERFIKNNNLNQGNKFKFIQRTEEIEEYRGIKVDDGIVRIEYWTEKIQPVVNVPIYHYYDHPLVHYWPIFNPYPSYCTGGSYNLRSYNMAFTTQSVECCSKQDEGITVPGSVSNQQFTTTSWFSVEEQSEVVILKLRGKVVNKKIVVPFSVKTKLVCSTCGKRSNSNIKFCPICGTALEII